MIQQSLAALVSVGYDTGLFQVLVRADLPVGYRAMTLPDGAVIGEAAFASQALLNHVLEEELRHLRQIALGRATEFGAGTAQLLEAEADEGRQFPMPEQ
jgi:hypothetical protein